MAENYDRRFRGLGAGSDLLVWRQLRALLYEAGGGHWPRWVIDAPAGTGRFTSRLRSLGIRVIHLDRSPEMLAIARRKDPSTPALIADLRRPPFDTPPQSVVLCFRYLQHCPGEERVAALRGLRNCGQHAVVAYYPGWHYKVAMRRLRRRVGLPHNVIREYIPRRRIREELARAGWKLLRMRQTLPLFSENLLLLLERHP